MSFFAFFVGNKIVLETISVAITDTSSACCFDQYLACEALRDLKQFIQFFKKAGSLCIINYKTKITYMYIYTYTNNINLMLFTRVIALLPPKKNPTKWVQLSPKSKKRRASSR